LSDNLLCYLQDEGKKDKSEANFIFPISSATNFNIQPLIFALNDILKEAKDEKTHSD
jgi:hypothetical protein